jgi:hypothetical protein
VGVINYTNYSAGPVSCFLKKTTCLIVLVTMIRVLTAFINLTKDIDIMLFTFLVLKKLRCLV